MLSHMPIARKLLIVPALAGLAILLVAGFFVLGGVLDERYDEENSALSNRLVAVNAAKSELAEAQAMVFRGVAFLNVGVRTEDVRGPVHEGLRRIEVAVDRMAGLEEVRGEVRHAVDVYWAAISHLVTTVEVDPFLAAMYLNNADDRYQEARDRLDRAASAIAAEAVRSRTRAEAAKHLIWALCLSGVGVLFVISVWSTLGVARAIAKPLAEIVTTTVALADGELDRAIPGLERRDEVGSIASALEVFRDTARQLNQQAYFDRLTSVANRANFQKALLQALSASAHDATRGALLLIDLDRFKEVNDTLGHDAGDAVLCAAARALCSHVRESDLVARLGGDEFAVLLRTIGTDGQAGVLAGRLIEAISVPMQANGQEVHVGASIGIALFPEHGTTPEDLLKHADIAMYRAKANHNGSFSFFDVSFDAAIVRRKAIEAELRRILADGALHLAFQPKYRLDDGCIASVEALARWPSARGDVSPSEFIPIAEASGLIADLGTWALRESCRQLRAWHATNVMVPRVSVNVSALQLRRAGFAREVQQIVQSCGVSPRHLVIELTESVFADPDHVATQENIVFLDRLGFGLSIDDFGTGFSSMGYLMRMPFDELKIDRSYVQDLCSSEAVRGVVHGIIDLGHALGMRVVAEGIETAEHLAALRALGCDIGQGYLLSTPGPACAIDRSRMRSPQITGVEGRRAVDAGFRPSRVVPEPA